MIRRLAAVFVFACALRADPGPCPGGVAVTTFRLSASPATATRTWIPVRQINNLPSGYRVRYQPGMLPPDVGKEAAVALVRVEALNHTALYLWFRQYLADIPVWRNLLDMARARLCEDLVTHHGSHA